MKNIDSFPAVTLKHFSFSSFGFENLHLVSTAKQRFSIIAIMLLAVVVPLSGQPQAGNENNEALPYAEDYQNAQPAIAFCINGITATVDSPVIICNSTGIEFSFCDAENLNTPLNICWDFNGESNCANEAIPGDVLFNVDIPSGTYEIQITSISDQRGMSLINTSGLEFSVEIINQSQANAGIDATICEGQNYTLAHANAQNYSAVLWSGGDGIFVPSADILNPTYIPGPQDIMNGESTLCLSADSENPCTSTASDCITLTIRHNASANAGQDITVCEDQNFAILIGQVESGMPAWQATAYTGGFFENSNSETTKYYFSDQDVETGIIELCLMAVPNAPCFVPQSDCMNVTIIKSPVANAGPDMSICANEPVLLNQASVENSTAVQWTSNGDGVFVDENAINTMYLPGTNDLSNSTVELCLTALADDVCTTADMDCKHISFIHSPQLDMPLEHSMSFEDYDVAAGKWLPVTLTNSISGDYQSIVWATNGDGTFDDITAQNPKYFPDNNDTWNGEIVVCITIEPAADCHNPVFQCMTIQFPQQFVSYNKDGWHGISSYLDPDLNGVTEVMDPLVEIPGSRHLVSMMNAQGKVFLPELVPPLVTLTNWEPVGYKIKLKNTSAAMPIYGNRLSEQTFTVDGQFTYLPVLTNIPVSIESLFQDHINHIMMIYDWTNGQLWTPVANDFDSIFPGYAYLLINQSGTDPYTIEYPDFEDDAPLVYPNSGLKHTLVNNSPWEQSESGGSPHVFTFTKNALSKLQQGDVLGVFNQQEACLGSAEFMHDCGLFKLIAMGTNISSGSNRGFEEGERMHFKIYHASSKKQSEVFLRVDENYPASDKNFKPNSLSLVTDILFPFDNNEQHHSGALTELKIYPNPATKHLNIKSSERISEVIIINMQGQQALSLTTEDFDATLQVSGLKKGMYAVIIRHDNNQTTTEKITIQ